MSTHGPIEDAYLVKMNALAHVVDDYFNKGAGDRTGFVLLVFPFGDKIDGRINYISNGEREDIISALKEILARFEGRMPEGAGHG